MCDICMPSLMPENRQVFEIFMKVQSQHIMGFSGPVDLNFQSVQFIMDLMGVANRKEVFEKVYKLYNMSLQRIRDQAKNKQTDPGKLQPQLDPRLRKYLKK